MPDPPWIVDAWVNLLRPAGGAEGASIFGRYGQLPALREGTKPEDLVAEMDAVGVALAGLCGTDAAWVAETCARWPGRFFGMVSPDPRDIMACLRTIETCVREHGFKAVKIEPFVWGKPPTDRMYYPSCASWAVTSAGRGRRRRSPSPGSTRTSGSTPRRTSPSTSRRASRTSCG